MTDRISTEIWEGTHKKIQKFNKFSGATYDEFKAAAIELQPLDEKKKLSDLYIDKFGALYINGHPIKSVEGIENQLLKCLNLSPKHLENIRQLSGEKTKQTLVGIIKNELSKKKLGAVTVLSNPISHVVTHIIPLVKTAKKFTGYISNVYAFKNIENILENYPQLEISGYSIQDDGSFMVNMKIKERYCPRDREGNFIDGEEYSPGLSLINEIGKGMFNLSFMERLICKNGLVRYETGKGTAKLLDEEKKSYHKFHDRIAELSKANFSQAEGYIRSAMETKASFYEAQRAFEVLVKNSNVSMEAASKFLPEFIDAERKMYAKGIEWSLYNPEQLKCCPTNASVWDIVNRLTYFGSHDLGFNADYAEIQKGAGQLYSKSYDTNKLELYMRLNQVSNN